MDIIGIIKKAAFEAVQAGKPMQVYLGKVTSRKPLKVKINDNLILEQGDDMLLVPDSLYDHDYERVVFESGDTLIMLRDSGGQRFVIIDKAVIL